MAIDDNIRVLFIGEIVGKAGLYSIKHLLPDLKKEFEIDITIAAAEGVTYPEPVRAYVVVIFNIVP